MVLPAEESAEIKWIIIIMHGTELAHFYCQPIKRPRGQSCPSEQYQSGGQANMLGRELIWPAATINSHKAADSSLARWPAE